jgi:hypothetical protein
MSRKRYSEKEKQKAVKMLLAGKHTQKQVAEKFGCTVTSLLSWKKETQNGLHETVQEESAEIEKEIAQCCLDHGCSAPSPKKGTADDFVRKFWNKNFRAVDILLNPKDVTSEEAVKLVNEALLYAYEQLQK